MGKVFGDLTHSAVISPDGTVTWNASPQAEGKNLASAQSKEVEPSSASVGDSGVSFNQPSKQFSQVAKPSFQQAAAMGSPAGTPNALSPGLTKGGKLAVLLMSGLQGALAGRGAQEQMAAQTGGRRAGGVGTAFSAGYQLPFTRAMQPLQLQQQQAETGLAQAGLQPVQTPYGNMPAALASKILTPYLGAQGRVQAAQQIGQSRENAAQTTANATVQKAQIGAQNKLDVVGLQTAITANKGARFLPDWDPETKMPFYHVLNPFGQEIGRTDVNAIPSLMQRTTDSIEWQQADDGTFHALPKTSTSGPVLPGGATPQPAQPGAPQPAGRANPQRPQRTGGGTPNFQGKNALEMVQGTDASGRQVAGTVAELRGAGVQNFTKMPANNASQVVTARSLTSKGGLFDMVDADLKKFSPEELNGLSNRWQEFLTGTFGADDRYIALRTHLNGLTGTALMQAHVGSRGGEHMMDHFADLADAHKFTYSNLKTAVDAERQYVDERAMRPTAVRTPQPKRAGQQGGNDPLGIR